MTSGFTFLRVDAYYQEIVKGMIIVAAVVLDDYRQKKRKEGLMLDTSSSRHADTRAIVTGGAQGLGLAIARRLVADGCTQIVLAGRDELKGAAAVDALVAAGASASFVRADLAEVDGLLPRSSTRRRPQMGGANALVNAAAACDRGGLLDTTPEIRRSSWTRTPAGRSSPCSASPLRRWRGASRPPSSTSSPW